MSGKGFIFDLNKCVGCHACVVACQIENVATGAMVWREVSSSNRFQHPGIPLFNLSMACNHCRDAPCLENCPALAYSQDRDTKAILHNPSYCIGCKYCTWVCPYDAPKFNAAKGIIEKCTLCHVRIGNGMDPACVIACPTGALSFGAIMLSPSNIPGFPEVGIRPAIQITPLRTSKPPRHSLHLKPKEKELYSNLSGPRQPTKVSLKHEWALALFTIMASLQFSYLFAAFTGHLPLFPRTFITAGIMGFLLSSMHLGHKTRAWRSVLNIRRSWLSREILGYAIFLLTGTAWLLYPRLDALGIISLMAGSICLWSIDRVYHEVQQVNRWKFHSAEVLFFTTILFIAVLTSNHWAFFLTLGIKLLLYLKRKIVFCSLGWRYRPVLTAFRIISGIALPWIIVMLPGISLSNILVLCFILAGELTDRFEFYLEMEVVIPNQ
jgi:Fe-S-cluster-containing dehydrogenase component